jgi:hypothetical protein
MRKGHLKAIAVLSATLSFVTVAGAAHERVERRLTLDEAIGERVPVRFENLLGSIRLRGGGEAGHVKVEAKVVAEGETEEQAQELADAIRLERRDDDDHPLIHVAYPVDDYTAFKIPRAETDNPISRWVTPLLKKFNKSTVSTVYDGESVALGQSKGARGLAVHLTITVPHDVHATMRQSMGSVECDLLRGHLEIENLEGHINLGRLYGTLQARTAGGDLSILTFKGDRARIQTASGSVQVVDVAADELHLRTTSGTIEGRAIKTDAMNVEADSGGIELAEVEARRFSIHTESGNVDLAARLQRTQQATIESVSGDVTLRVGKLAPFDLEANTDSGSVKALDGSFKVEQKEKTDATVHRGTGGADLDVKTASGTVVLKTR